MRHGSKNPLGTSAKVPSYDTFFTLEGKNNCTITVKVKERNSGQRQIKQRISILTRLRGNLL